MRNPDRIEPFLAKLAEYWHKVPDWRFGQLICNLPFSKDQFFVEEDEFIETVDKLFNKTEEDDT